MPEFFGFIRKFLMFFKANKNKQIKLTYLLSNNYEILLLIPIVTFLCAPVIHIITDLALDSSYAFSGFYNFHYSVNYARYITFLITPLALIFFIINKKNKHSKIILSDFPLILPFLIFSVLAVISTAVNGFTTIAKAGDSYRQESIFSYISYFIGFYLCASLIKNEKIKKFILDIFLLSTVIVNSMQLFHSFIKEIKCFEWSDQDYPSAIFYQFNHYGYFLMLAVIISAGLFTNENNIRVKVMSLISLITNTFILSMNSTFGSFLSLLVGFVFLIVFSSLRINKLNYFSLTAFGSFVIVTFIAGLKYHSFFSELSGFFTDINSVVSAVSSAGDNISASSTADSAGTGRWSLWRNTITYIKERPLFGFGIEGIADRLYADTHGTNNRPHNEYLQYAVFFGIPAAISYLIGLIIHFIKAVKSRHSLNVYQLICLVAAFTYLVNAIFGNTMFYTAPYLFIFLGLSAKGETNEANHYCRSRSGRLNSRL